jgi:hypothetical protein
MQTQTNEEKCTSAQSARLTVKTLLLTVERRHDMVAPLCKDDALSPHPTREIVGAQKKPECDTVMVEHVLRKAVQRERLRVAMTTSSSKVE